MNHPEKVKTPEEIKAEAKAAKEAEKEAKAKAAKEAKEAKEAASAQAKAAKEAEKKAKAEAKASKAKVKQPNQNGVTRPTPDGSCGKVWALADSMSAHLKQPVPISTLIVETRKHNLNDATTRTQYARWKVYNGVVGAVPKIPAPEASHEHQHNTNA
jgi:hypothetical protein